jgi:hypothetical protein
MPARVHSRECAKGDEKAAKAQAEQWTKSLSLEGETKKDFSKLNERTGNVSENKGPLWKTGGRSWYVYENTSTYPTDPGMLLKTN